MSDPEDRPSLFAPARFVDRLEDCFFYHTIELPGFGLVAGQWDLRDRFDDYLGHVTVAGKSVLDVGTATGFLSFEAEKRGATRVVSFDMSDSRQQTFLPFKEKLSYQEPQLFAEQHGAEIEQWRNAYWLCHRLLKSRAEVYYGDINHLPTELGMFDIAIVGSVLEHLNDQIGALASIARLTAETMVIVTPLIESDERIARFEGRADKPAADFTWWTYSLGTYREVFRMLGFRIARVTQEKYYYTHAGRFEERSTMVAVREELAGDPG